MLHELKPDKGEPAKKVRDFLNHNDCEMKRFKADIKKAIQLLKAGKADLRDWDEGKKE